MKRSCPSSTHYILVKKRTLGGFMGYSSGKYNSSLKTPPTHRYQCCKLCILRRGGPVAERQLTLVRRLIWAGDGDVEVTEVVIVRCGGYTRWGIRHEPLGLLHQL